MKKIIILAFMVIILASCGNTEIIEKIEPIQEKPTQIKIDNIETIDKNIEKKITFSDLEYNLSKIKSIDLDEQKIMLINEELKNIFTSSIIEKAKKENDIKMCTQLNSNSQNFCEMEIIVNSKNVDNCNNLSNTWSIDSCKNDITMNLASKELNEKLCDNLIDKSEKKNRINSCKNEILFEKALKNLDIKFCDKISETSQKESCKNMLKMEKEMKLEQEKMEKEMKLEQEKMENKN